MKITDEMLREAAGEAAEVLTQTAQRDYVPGSFVPSPEFQGRMEALLRRSRRPFVPTLLRRAAAAALVLLLGCGSWLALDAEAREAFTGWVRGVYDTYVTYRNPGHTEETPIPDEERHYRLGWIPEGYTEVRRREINNGMNIVYEDTNKRKLSFSYIRGEGDILLIPDTDRMIHSFVSVDDVPADLWISDDPVISPALVWTSENGTNFFLSGFLDVDDLVRLAESIELE